MPELHVTFERDLTLESSMNKTQAFAWNLFSKKMMSTFRQKFDADEVLCVDDRPLNDIFKVVATDTEQNLNKAKEKIENVLYGSANDSHEVMKEVFKYRRIHGWALKRITGDLSCVSLLNSIGIYVKVVKVA